MPFTASHETHDTTVRCLALPLTRISPKHLRFVDSLSYRSTRGRCPNNTLRRGGTASSLAEQLHARREAREHAAASSAPAAVARHTWRGCSGGDCCLPRSLALVATDQGPICVFCATRDHHSSLIRTSSTEPFDNRLSIHPPARSASSRSFPRHVKPPIYVTPSSSPSPEYGIGAK